MTNESTVAGSANSQGPHQMADRKALSHLTLVIGHSFVIGGALVVHSSFLLKSRSSVNGDPH
jgi:hypothetical protein